MAALWARPFAKTLVVLTVFFVTWTFTPLSDWVADRVVAAIPIQRDVEMGQGTCSVVPLFFHSQLPGTLS